MPGWLLVADVKAFMGLGDAVDDATLGQAADAVEPFVEKARPDAYPPDASGQPDYAQKPAGDAYYAALQLTARLYQRRNSTVGVAAFNDLGGPVYVSKFDPDIERGLRVGGYARPRLG